MNKTSEVVHQQIVALTSAGMPPRTISAELGVSRTTISHVQKEFSLNPRPRVRDPLPEAVAKQIRELLARGRNWQTIRRELDVPRADVLAIVRDFWKSTPRKKKVIEKKFARFQARVRQELGCDPQWLQQVLAESLRGKK